MILAVHTLAGACLSNLPINVLAIFVISFVSHFLIDAIPHGDEMFFKGRSRDERLRAVKKLILVDSSVTLFFIIAFLITTPIYNYPALIAGIFGNLLPDFLMSLYEIPRHKKLFKGFYEVHTYFHDYIKWQPNFTFIVQIILLAVFVKIAF